ncbi:hypothetical protein [Paenibacillus sp. DMB20]|uniref:hypothetical protein n=1 Tax=Paenibacillus sp. DMB20 TaxID=1642570 RepID=UPI000627E6CE|nr:hypothetical protein [Paenibacillus sp. DMB20]KKO53697.1 hypothetical protein XI25_11985 [Paenibacillus sp. DMB20]
MEQHPPSPSKESKKREAPSEVAFIPPEDKKHSRLGITSFVLAIVTLLGYIIMASLGTAMIEPYMTPNGPVEPPKEALEAMTSLAAVFVIIVAVNFIGLLLGLAGSFNPKNKRSFSVVGSILNGVVLVTILALFIFVLNG